MCNWLKCLQIKGRESSIELFEQSPTCDSRVRVLSISAFTTVKLCPRALKTEQATRATELRAQEKQRFVNVWTGGAPGSFWGLTLAKRRLYWPTTAGSGQSSFLMISKLWFSCVKMSTTELENRACSDVGWNCGHQYVLI